MVPTPPGMETEPYEESNIPDELAVGIERWERRIQANADRGCYVMARLAQAACDIGKLLLLVYTANAHK